MWFSWIVTLILAPFYSHSFSPSKGRALDDLMSSLASFFNHGAMGTHDVLFLGSQDGGRGVGKGEYERLSLFSPSHLGLQVQAALSSLPFAEICFPPPPA